MTWLIVSWVLIYLVASVYALSWLAGSWRRLGWLVQAKINGAMLIEAQGQRSRGIVATVQTVMGLAIGLLSLFQVPGRSGASIVLLMGIAVLTMALRRLEVTHRKKLEKIYGHTLEKAPPQPTVDEAPPEIRQGQEKADG